MIANRFIHRDNKKVLAQVAAFNRQVSIGDPVWLENDDGVKSPCLLRGPAIVLDSGAPVAWVTGKSGAWLLDRITPREVAND